MRDSEGSRYSRHFPSKESLENPGYWDETCEIGKSASPTKPAQLSVVLPVFNEQGSVERVVRECVAYLSDRVPDHEILIVNDGSNDNTREILNRLATEFRQVRVMHHSQNKGYGSALRTGFAAATKGLIFYMDSDGQFDIRDLDHLLALATDDDHVVTGFRLGRCDPLTRRLSARCFGALVMRVIPTFRVRDLNCAFKLIPKKVLDVISLESTGAFISGELYGRAVQRGFGIKEIGIRHYSRRVGRPTGAHLSVILRAFYDLARLRHRITADPKVHRSQTAGIVRNA
jgi:glycosyltransferase involved in cell wall biosynthesis